MTPPRPEDTMDIVTGTPPGTGGGAQAGGDEPPLLPGVKLGQYKVLKKLGEGGMGRVYLAEHVVIGRRVALKVLRRSLAENPLSVERFFAEAHAVNRIRHAGIVVVTDLFVAEQMPCIVMELLEGKTLAQEVAQEGPLPAERVLAIGAQIAAALEAVHDAGIIHRDLKPDNIFLLDERVEGGERRVKILDFGVAKLGTTQLGVGGGRTIAGAIIGTPEYMAPEQLAGKPIDLRADIYAFAVLLFFAATGRTPFSGDSFGELVVKHLSVPPPRLRAIVPSAPRALEAALLAMLEKDPDARPPSVAAAAALLRAPEPPLERRARAGALVAAGAAVVVVLIVAAIALSTRSGGDDDANPAPTTAAQSPAAPTTPAPMTPSPTTPAVTGTMAPTTTTTAATTTAATTTATTATTATTQTTTATTATAGAAVEAPVAGERAVAPRAGRRTPATTKAKATTTTPEASPPPPHPATSKRGVIDPFAQ